MTVGERIKTISQDWFLTEPLIFAVLCTHALKRNDNMGCDMRCGKGLIEYNPERLEHFDDNQLALRLKAEVVRIILKHPYQRQPYNPRRDVMRLSSDLTLCDNLDGMDTIGLEPPRVFNIPRDQAFEQYYSLMAGQILQLEQDADGDGIPIDMNMPGSGQGSGDSDLTDSLLDADAGASLWEEDELMSEKVNHEIETAQRCNQWGSLGGDLRALIESTLVSKQNFRAILSQFRATILSTKRHLTRMRPNRRYGFDAMGSQYASASSSPSSTASSSRASRASRSLSLTAKSRPRNPLCSSRRPIASVSLGAAEPISNPPSISTMSTRSMTDWCSSPTAMPPSPSCPMTSVTNPWRGY